MEELQSRPPVLVDIGAAGGLHPAWSLIKEFSICLAFDANQEAIQELESERSNYRELHLIPKAVTSETVSEAKVFITKSRYCSSLLRPGSTDTGDWWISELFDVTETAHLPATTLKEELTRRGLDRVDWYKSDSQGMDLRLFKSLPPEIMRKVHVANFEPHVVAMYENDDKLSDVLDFMAAHPFLLVDVNVEGTPLMPADLKSKHFYPVENRTLSASLRRVPGWASTTYLNRLEPEAAFGKRDVLLGWVTAQVLGYYAWGLRVATYGQSHFGDNIFDEMVRRSTLGVRLSYRSLLKKVLRRLWF